MAVSGETHFSAHGALQVTYRLPSPFPVVVCSYLQASVARVTEKALLWDAMQTKMMLEEKAPAGRYSPGTAMVTNKVSSNFTCGPVRWLGGKGACRQPELNPKDLPGGDRHLL